MPKLASDSRLDRCSYRCSCKRKAKRKISLVLIILFVAFQAASSFGLASSSSKPTPFRRAFGWSASRQRSQIMATSPSNAEPPVARREENRVVWAGVAPEGWDPDVPRQSETSTEKLVDPPRAVPDPYGWMRDEERSNKEVLQHIKDENLHTERRTAHLEELRSKIYAELLKTMQETDHSLPRPCTDILPKSGSVDGIRDRYFYYSRTIKDKSYGLHCRAKIDPGVVGTTEAEESEYLRHHLQLWDGTPEMPVLPNEEIYVDENVLAHGYEQFELSSLEPSPSSRFMAYTVDTTGEEVYDIVVQNIVTREVVFNSNEDFNPDDRRELELEVSAKKQESKLESDERGCDVSRSQDDADNLEQPADERENKDAREKCDDEEEEEEEEDDGDIGICEELEWGNNDRTLFYIMQDNAQRPYRIFRKTIPIDDGDELVEDELIYEENDMLFCVGMYKTLDHRYLIIDTASAETSEIHFLDLEDSRSTIQCIAKRRSKVLYGVDHRRGAWWITSNVGGSPNMKLFTAPAKANCEDEWELVKFQDNILFDGGYDIALEDVTALGTHAIVEGRQGGIPRIWVMSLDGDSCDVTHIERLEFPEAAHDVGLGSHWEMDIKSIVVGYDSLVTPSQNIEIPLDRVNNQEDRIVVTQRQIEGYSKEDFACERVTVASRDGETQIPVSLVYHKEVAEKNKKDGTRVHVHLDAYGAYGSSFESDFDASRLPLMGRGMVYAIAHVRGGAEMGRQWYEEPKGGKYLCKKNTFNDFIDVARWLIDDRKLTSPNLLSCEGRSAGGMTVGAAINQAPELFKASILGVPFVDTVATMVDASLPLVAGEWEEWGNPNEEKYLDYMLSYDPMKNVKEGRSYPSMLLLAGLHDTRVQYWEPAKFAATLRHCQESATSGPVCLKVEMNAGHFSASDRYKYLRELSFDYAFLLDQVGLANRTIVGN